MMDAPLLSVIIPVYNIAPYLRRCLNSVISQSYKNFEIICVDDGSTDEGPKILREYDKKDSRIRIISKKNGGLVSARKTGGEHIAGDYVINIDSDDYIDTNYLEAFVEVVKNGKYNQVWSISMIREYGNDEFLTRSALTDFKQTDNDELSSKAIQGELYRKAIGWYGYQDDVIFSMCSKCIESGLFQRIYSTIPESCSYHEDVSFSIRCLAEDRSIYFIDNPGYHYVQRETSISHVREPEEVHQIMRLHEDTLSYLKHLPNFQYTKNIADGAYISAMVLKNFEGIQTEDKDYLVPFDGVTYGSKIIIFGMGNVGNVIATYIANSQNFTLVGCTDNRYVEGDRFGYVAPDKIDYSLCDYVLIATVKCAIIKQIEEQLIKYGVPTNKIKRIYH